MSKPLPEALLDLKKWDQLSREECVEVAFQVERLLPSSFRFTSLETFTSASDHHHIAYFEWTTPLGPSLTHQDLQMDPQYGGRGLTSNLEAHEDWLDLPQQLQKKLLEHVEYLNKHHRPPYSDKQYTTKLALIPGNTITLGYDREHPLLPSDELIYDAEEERLIPTIDGSKRVVPYEVFHDVEEEDLAQSGEKWNGGNVQSEENDPFFTPIRQSDEDPDDWKKTPPNYAAIAEYLDAHLLPHRTVTLRPFLLEQSYMHIGEFLNLLAVYYCGQNQYGFHSSSLHCGGSFPVSHRLVTGLLERQGFRLPSSDEWEYA